MTRFTTTVPTTLLSALSEYFIVFLSSSSSSLNLKIDRLPLAFIARNRFDFSEQWFSFFPNLIKYKEKEIRVVLSVKMASQHQTKDSGSKKNGDKELGMVAPQDKSSKEMKSSKKMKFASSSAETEPTSQTTISDDSKTGRGMSTMPRVVKRKLQKLRPIVEYNKRGKSYIGVLARSRVPLVDKKWSQIPKDIKEQIWEAVDMAFVVGQGGKNFVLASAAKKWKDFKLSKDFESVHSQHAQIREKLEYNHRLSRKGYAGLEDELEETMPRVEIDRSTLWKRARQDKHGNIPDPKVAEKAKLIDELQKQVSEGKVSVYGSNDRLKGAFPESAFPINSNFDPGMLKQRISQSPKNPMSDKASCSGGEDDNAKNGKHQQEEGKEEEKRDEEKKEEKEKEDEEKHDDKVIEVGDYSNMEAPSSLKTLCRYVETTLLPEDKILQFTIDKEVFGVNAIPSSCLKILHNLQAWKKLELLCCCI
ncbi:non-ATPase subunit 9, partial [Prunus dulcis]